mgnify:CR=1 FL=1
MRIQLSVHPTLRPRVTLLLLSRVGLRVRERVRERVRTGRPLKTTDKDLQVPVLPVKVRGLRYLVGGTGAAGGALFPSYIPQSTAAFPLSFQFNHTVHVSSATTTPGVAAADSIKTLGQHIREILDQELDHAGAMLFKKMPHIKSAEDFSDLMAAIGYSQFDYSGVNGVPRNLFDILADSALHSDMNDIVVKLIVHATTIVQLISYSLYLSVSVSVSTSLSLM